MKLVKGFTAIPLVIAGTIILLVVFALVKGSQIQLVTNRELPTPTTVTNVKNNQVNLTGVVWTSGLMEQKKETLNIDSDYQIVKALLSNGWIDKISGMYLVSDGTLDLSSYLGKCVTINGRIKSEWENLINNNYEINGKWTYNRSAIIIDGIEVEDIDLCKGDYDRTIKDKNVLEISEYKTAIGILGFAERPAPDISYDLEIILNEPFIDELNSSGNPVLTKRLDVSPGTGEIYKQIINNIGRKVEIGGYMEWGYAESRFLRVEKLTIL